jgi:tRNA_anti-like
MVLSKKNVAIIVAIIVALLVLYFYKEYQRKPADLTGIQPVAKINAAIIIDQYTNDESKANQQYLGKIIEVDGMITEIINQQDTLINVLLGDTNSVHKVSCLLDKRYFNEIKIYHTGQPITIKGICTGFLMDAELNRCVIITGNKK